MPKQLFQKKVKIICCKVYWIFFSVFSFFVLLIFFSIFFLTITTGKKSSHLFTSIAKEILKIESELDRLDGLAGDGDCGQTHSRGAQGIVERGGFFR